MTKKNGEQQMLKNPQQKTIKITSVGLAIKDTLLAAEMGGVRKTDSKTGSED